MAATAIVGRTKRIVADAVASARSEHNLVPDEPSCAPNYWCTWAAQNYMYGHNLANLNPEVLEGDSGSKLAHEAATEKVLFGQGGWVNSFLSKKVARISLFFSMMVGKLGAPQLLNWIWSSFLALREHSKAASGS